MKTAFVAVFAVSFSFSAQAAQVTGQVKAASVPIFERTLGYTKTRIMATSSVLRNKKEDLALYLEVKNSLPLKQPTERRVVSIHGLSFSPAVTSCVVDEVIVFKNEDRRKLTVKVGDKSLGLIEPREELSYKCETKGLSQVRLKEWKHARATIFVGTTGVAARPDVNGFFTLFAPEGTYDLKVINESGVILTNSVEIGTEDLELGLLGAEQTVEEMPAAAEEATDLAAEDAPPPPGPAIAPPPVVPSPAAAPPPVPAAAIPSPQFPKANVKPAAPAQASPKPAPVAAPSPAPTAAKPPPPAAKPPPPAAKPPPPPAAKPPPPAAKPPPPKPKPKPAPEPEEEEEDSLDDFFEMEE